MSQYHEKTLPRGTTWLYLNRLPDNLTDVELQAFLAARGIHLPFDHISVRNFPQGKSAAKIAVPNNVVQDLLNWCLKGDELRGSPVKAAVIQK